MRSTIAIVSVLAACGAKPSPPTTTTTTTAPAPPTGGVATRPPPAVDAHPDTPHPDAELSAVASSIFSTYTNNTPVLTRDGKRVVFVSNRGGLPQLYVGDLAAPEAKPILLSSPTERVGALVLTHDGKAVVFSSDHGADENWSYFRVDLDGTNPSQLASTTKRQRDLPLLPEGGKPDAMFYSARTLAATGSDLYMASAKAPGDEKLVFHDDKPGFLVDVRRDGKLGLWQRTLSQSETYLATIDLDTGAMKPLYPSAGKVTIDDAKFSRDGKRVLVATDGGGEQGLVLALDTATGKELARYTETKPATATIAELTIAHGADVVAIVVNAGNHNEVRLLDARTLKVKSTVAVPLGTGATGSFSPDGKRLALDWSSPSSPQDIFAMDVASGKLTPLRGDARPQLAALGAIESSIVEIEAFDHTKIPTNVYLPADAKTKRVPVIVSYHGGPAGSAPIRWSPIVRFFLSQGYAWVEPNVRGSSGFGRAYEAADNGAKRLDAFKDIETAGRWAGAQPWADKDRVVVFGSSYGGYTVLVGLTRMPELWRAGVDLVGIANLETFMATTSGVIRELFLVEFGDPDKDAALLASISPLRDADKIVAPLFVYAGANDPRVPRTESDQIVVALRKRAVPVEYMVASDEGHSLARIHNQIELCARVARFLDTHLHRP